MRKKLSYRVHITNNNLFSQDYLTVKSEMELMNAVNGTICIPIGNKGLILDKKAHDCSYYLTVGKGNNNDQHSKILNSLNWHRGSQITIL